jgi:hypothetical protein
MRILCAARKMSAPELLRAHVECGGLPPLSVAEACLPRRLLAGLGDSTDAITKRNRFSAQRPSGNHASPVTIHQSKFPPQQSDTPCKVIDHPARVVVPSESAVADEPRDLSAILSDTPCKAICLVSHRKQTIGTLTKCHTFSSVPRAICWPALHAFRIIAAPISDKESRVQGR